MRIEEILKHDDIQLIRHASVEDVFKLFTQGHAIDDIDAIGGYDQDGQEYEFVSPGDIIDNLKEVGCFSITHLPTKQIHFWIDESVAEFCNVLAMFAHERAHLIPEQRNYPEEVYDELVAEEYSAVALWAYQQAKQYCQE